MCEFEPFISEICHVSYQTTNNFLVLVIKTVLTWGQNRNTTTWNKLNSNQNTTEINQKNERDF